MRWPLVWRSALERERQIADKFERDYDAMEARAEAAEGREAEATRELRHLRALRESVGVVVPSEVYRKDLAGETSLRVVAEVRAEQWEAIARELISRGAGRPKPEGEAKERSKIAEKIRDESGGDPALAGHFWKLARQMKAAGKTDDEIVGAIGWETGDPPDEKTT